MNVGPTIVNQNFEGSILLPFILTYVSPIGPLHLCFIEFWTVSLFVFTPHINFDLP